MKKKKEDIFLYSSDGSKKVNFTKSRILIHDNEFDDNPDKVYISANGNYFLIKDDHSYFQLMNKKDVLSWIIKNYPQWLYNNPEWVEDMEEI